MSTSLTFMITLSVTAILCLFSNSWTSIWILLEMNTLAFCSLLFVKFSNEAKKNKEVIMKYLIIQAIASALLVTASLLVKTNGNFFKTSAILATLALMTKAASAPTHQWFVNMSKKINWINNTILWTWQKLAPIFLVIYQMKILILPFLMASAILGATAMINKSQTKEIMALSSIFNLSWMFLAITISLKVFLVFSAIYWTSLLFVLFLLNKNNTNNMQEMTESKKDKIMLMLMLMSIAGLPPLMGFMAKWLTFYSSLKMNMKTLASILLILSAINLYVYLRLINPTVMKNSSSYQKFLSVNKNFSTSMFFLFNAFLMAMVIL